MDDANRLQSLGAGLSLIEQGRLNEARVCLSAALEAQPNNPLTLNGLGIVARRLGELPAAVTWFERALDHRPDFAEAYCNLGNAMQDLGQWREAASFYRCAIQFKPSLAEAHLGLGNCLVESKDFAAAIAMFREAIRLRAGLASAHGNLGNALHLNGDPANAVVSFQEALRLQPDSAEHHCNLSNALRDLGRIGEAIQHAEMAIQKTPNLAEAYNSLGLANAQCGQYDSALTQLQIAVRLKPEQESFRLNLAAMMRQSEDTEGAAQVYQSLCDQQPRDWRHHLRYSATCPVVFGTREAMTHYLQRSLDQWQRFADARHQVDLQTVVEQLIEPPFQLQFFAECLRPWKVAYAGIFRSAFAEKEGSRVAHPLRGPHFKNATASTLIHRERPRMGFVVTRGHEGVFLLSIGEILRRLDPDLAECFVFCHQANAARVQAALRTDSITVVPLPSRFDQMATCIRESQCDLLHYWEIGTDTANYFLPFLRLAPVQCTASGTQVTSGIPNVDFYLSSRWIEPHDAASHYSESLVLVDSLFTYRPWPKKRMPLKRRSDFGFRSSENLYACPQQLGKFHPDFDDWIAAILRHDPAGRMVAVEDRCRANARKLQARWERTMPDVVDRVTMLPRLSANDYHDLLAAVDVLLDAPHFSGSNSTYDALAIGQPVVTCPSRFQRGRTTLGCYRRMGFLDCVATSPERYVQIAVELGTNEDRRQEVTKQLQHRRELLFEDASVIEAHERTFRNLLTIATEKRAASVSGTMSIDES